MPKKSKRQNAPLEFASHVWRGFIGGQMTAKPDAAAPPFHPRTAFVTWLFALLEGNRALREALLSPVFYPSDDQPLGVDEHFQQEILCYVSLLGRRVTATNSLLGELPRHRFTTVQVLLLELLRASLGPGWRNVELVRLPGRQRHDGGDPAFAAMADRLEALCAVEAGRGFLRHSAFPTLRRTDGCAHLRNGASIVPFPEELSFFDVLGLLSHPLPQGIVRSVPAWNALWYLIRSLNRPYGNRVQTGLPFDAHFVWLSLKPTHPGSGGLDGDDADGENGIEDGGSGIGVRLSDPKCRTIIAVRKEIESKFGRGRIDAESVRAVWPTVAAQAKAKKQSTGYHKGVEEFLQTREGRYFVDRGLMRFKAAVPRDEDGEVVYVPAHANVPAVQGASVLACADAPSAAPMADPDLDPSTDEDTPAWMAWLAAHGRRMTRAERLWIDQARDGAHRRPHSQAALVAVLADDAPYALVEPPARMAVFEFFRDRLLDRIRGLSLRRWKGFLTEAEERIAELEATGRGGDPDVPFEEWARQDNMLMDILSREPPYSLIAQSDPAAALSVLGYFWRRDVRPRAARPATPERR